jgi:hypothetical protein
MDDIQSKITKLCKTYNLDVLYTTIEFNRRLRLEASKSGEGNLVSRILETMNKNYELINKTKKEEKTSIYTKLVKYLRRTPSL